MSRRRFGRYEVEKEIGEGSMGRVYRCIDPLMHRIVAIKTIKTEYLTRDIKDEYLKRFRREAQAAGRLAHPHIVGIYDVGDDYFVMEYLEGRSLQAILRQRGRLPVEEALGILRILADVIDNAHRAGVIHRDIKPANVMVLSDGRPKLMDFGVARLESSVMTADGHFFGSPSYMAPEQVSGEHVTSSADLFSFAVLAYEVLTGRRPFEGDSITAVMYRVVNEQPPPPTQWAPDLPPVFDAIFRRALDKRPERRFRDAMSLVAALEARDLAAAGPSPTSTVPVESPGGQFEPPGLNAVGDMETQDLGSATPIPPTRGPMPARTGPGPGSQTLMGRPLWLLTGGAVIAVALAYYGGRSPLWKSTAALSTLTGPAVPLRVEAEPAGARVWVDGRDRGIAPVQVLAIAPGVHRVRVAAPGYSPANVSMRIRPGEPPEPLRFVLEPLTARLDVRSDPVGAAVTVDGAAAGTTPLADMRVAPGAHDVRLEKAGYEAFDQRIQGRADSTVTVNARLIALTRNASPSPAWVREGMLVPLDEAGLKPPRRVEGKSAAYPEAARRLRLLGSVTVEMVVNEKGETEDLHIVQSAGQVLDNAVLDAVRAWRYEPATKNGVKVKVRMQARHTFVETD